MVQVIGLTGSIQNGKIESTPVFQKHKWVFIDLNDPIYDRRRKGSERYEMYQHLIPNSLDDEGVETGAFYRYMKKPLYDQLLLQDIPYIGEIAKDCITTAKADNLNLVLSWEYLARIPQSLALVDYVLVTSSKKEIWYNRLRRRAVELGWNPPPTDDALTEIIQTLGVNPETIKQEVYQRFPASKITEIDVNDDDLGASKIDQFLKNIFVGS